MGIGMYSLSCFSVPSFSFVWSVWRGRLYWVECALRGSSLLSVSRVGRSSLSVLMVPGSVGEEGGGGGFGPMRGVCGLPLPSCLRSVGTTFLALRVLFGLTILVGAI